MQNIKPSRTTRDVHKSNSLTQLPLSYSLDRDENMVCVIKHSNRLGFVVVL